MPERQPLSPEEQVQLQGLLERAHAAATEDPNAESSSVREPSQAAASVAPVAMTPMSVPVLPPVGDQAGGMGYASTATPPPMPESVMTGPQFGATQRGTTNYLPPGVESLERWGQSLVDYGKYQSKGWTYSQTQHRSSGEVLCQVVQGPSRQHGGICS